VTDLRTSGIEIGYVRTLVVARYFESTSRAGGRLLEDETDFFARQMLLLGSSVLRPFEITGKIKQIPKLAMRVILDSKKRAIPQI
jgi:hypothetical protein